MQVLGRRFSYNGCMTILDEWVWRYSINAEGMDCSWSEVLHAEARMVWRSKKTKKLKHENHLRQYRKVHKI